MWGASAPAPKTLEHVHVKSIYCSFTANVYVTHPLGNASASVKAKHCHVIGFTLQISVIGFTQSPDLPCVTEHVLFLSWNG